MPTIREILQQVRGDSFDLRVGEECYVVRGNADTFSVGDGFGGHLIENMPSSITENDLKKIVEMGDRLYDQGYDDGFEGLQKAVAKTIGVAA